MHAIPSSFLSAAELPSSERARELALDASPLVVAGLLRVVGRSDAGTRRHFVLVASSAGPAPAATRRLRHAALAKLAAGQANKAIALELGLAESTISRALAAWCRALGVGSLAELAQLARALGREVRAMPGAGAWIASVDLDTAWAAAGLTSAETAVAQLAVRGHSNADIARLRDTSVATVVNQLGAVHRKLGTSGRVGLAGLAVRR